MAELSPAQHFSLLASAADADKVLISGPLIEVDKINKNGWGIDSKEINNYAAGLIGVPLRKCSGADELEMAHSCDYNWNPDDDIGRITGAGIIDGWLHAAAEITDSIAQRKIAEGTWNTFWSSFLSHTAQSAGNMLSGTKALSVTLVEDPAYTGAHFKVNSKDPLQGASNMTKDKDKPETFTKEDVDKLVAAATSEATKELLSREDVETQVAAAIEAEKEKTKDMLTKEDADKLVSAGIADAKASEEAASKKKETAGDNITQEQAEALVSAAVTKATEGSIPREDVEKLVAASVEQAKTATLGSIEKEQLVKDVLEIQVSAGLVDKDKTEDAVNGLMLKSAATLKADLGMLGKMQEALKAAGTEAVDKFKEANIPASGKSGGATFGKWDPVKKEWA